jgi:hypothetical protein
MDWRTGKTPLRMLLGNPLATWKEIFQRVAPERIWHDPPTVDNRFVSGGVSIDKLESPHANPSRHVICSYPLSTIMPSQQADNVELQPEIGSSGSRWRILSPNDWLAIASFLGIVMIIAWQAAR